MSLYSIDQLTTPLTVDEIKTAIYNSMAASGVTVTNWKPGAVVRTIIAAVAIVCAALSVLISLIARGGYLETAEGIWLRLLAKQQYNVDFQDATFASGLVALTNTGGGVFSEGVGEIVFRNNVTGKTYTNITSVSIAAFQSNVYCAIRAVEAGSASSALPEEISSFVTPLIGVTISQPFALVGNDAEEEPSLRNKCTDKLGSLSPNGPQDAYAFAAKAALRNDGTPIGVTRVRTVPDGFGGIDVYCATASGAVTGDADDPLTDLGAVNESIQRLATTLCVTARVHSAVPVGIPVSYEVWLYKSTMTEADIAAAIGKELTSFFAAQPIGGNLIDSVSVGRLYVTALEAAIGGVRTSTGARLGIFRVRITAPAADVAMSLEQLPVLGVVTPVGINQLPNPSGAT